MANLPNCSASKLLKNDNAEHNKNDQRQVTDGVVSDITSAV